MNEIAVVTAVTNSYDFHGPHIYNDNVDYIFFTDGSSGPWDDRWNLNYLPISSLDPKRISKIPKVNPHSIDLLNEYKYVIWIDGSMQIISEDFVPEILSYMENGFVLSPHFERQCAYKEGSLSLEKYQGEPRAEQLEHYKKEGFIENFGLYECGVMARDMTNDLVKEFGNYWFNEIVSWSSQDQISCPYALFKTGLQPDVIETSWRNKKWLHINAHKHEVGIPNKEIKMAERENLGVINSHGGRGHVARYKIASGFTSCDDIVVDAACGIGYASHIFDCKHYFGVDLLPEEERVEKPDDCDWIVADLTDWEIDFDFDVAVSFETIEHLEDYSNLIVQLKKAKKWIVASVPVIPTIHFNPFHKHDFEPRELIELFQDDNWELYQVLGQPSEVSEIYIFKNYNHDSSVI